MALTKTITKKIYGQEVEIDSVYIVVNELQVNKNQAIALVNFYSKDKSEIIEVKSYVHNINLEGVNFISQSYEYLKTLEEFRDAKDC